VPTSILFAQVEPARFGQAMTVVCFAGCYAVALVCELARFWYRGTLRRRIGLGMTALGFVAHTMYLVFRGAYASRGLPLTTMYESLVVLAWMLVLVHLYLAWRDRRSALGVFSLPVILALCIVAGLMPGRGARTDQPLSPFWGLVHGGMLLAGICAVAVAAVAGIMFLVQSYRLKAKKLWTPGLLLPSLERLERLNARANFIAFPLLTLGLALGVALTIAGSRGGTVRLDWLDPKVLSTVATWIVLALVLHMSRRPALRGRRVAYMTIAAFGLLLFSLVGTDLLLGTAHTPAAGVP